MNLLQREKEGEYCNTVPDVLHEMEEASIIAATRKNIIGSAWTHF